MPIPCGPGEEYSGHGQPAPETGRQAETRLRTDYYDSLYVDEQTRIRPAQVGRSSDTARSSAWDDLPAAEHPDRPTPESMHVPPERGAHILDGDRWGGGHRHGTGRPEKTEFPADWDDERIISQILDVARFPDVRPVMQANQRWRVQGERDGVMVTLIMHPDGRIWTAWPEEGSPGVIRNPRGQR